MDRSELLNLYTESVSYDGYGVPVKTTSCREVFCQANSVTRAEFFDGGRNGFNPEYRFTLFGGDYNGESVVGYKGLLYSVYRTYQARTDIIELYVERKGGTNGTENSNG